MTEGTATAIYDLLANDSELQSLSVNGVLVPIHEIQSLDSKPVYDDYFIILKWQENTRYSQSYVGNSNGISRSARNLEVWVHISLDKTRKYGTIDKILDRIDKLFDNVEHLVGQDGQTITSIGNGSRSGNLTDDGWKTATRNAVYGVLYRRST